MNNSESKFGSIELQRKLKLRYGILSLPEIGANFWSIPKCGNTSVKYACFQAMGIPMQEDVKDVYVSLHAVGIAEYIDKKTAVTNRQHNFSIIRNPVTRSQSMYNDLAIKRRGKSVEGSRKFKRDWQRFIESDHQYSDFVRLLAKYSDEERDIHMRGFGDRLLLNKKIVPHTVICIEDLNDRLPELNSKLTQPLEIPHLHRTSSNADDVSDTDRKTIERLWPRDVSLWKRCKL